MNGVSLFSSAGIAEYYLKSSNIEICVANELIEERAKLYKAQYPHAKMICGDILDDEVFNEIIKNSPNKVEFLLASPPCQGMSVAGKNRNNDEMLNDKRNFLVFRVIEFIKIKKPDFILIENVPNFLKLEFSFNNKMLKIEQILKELFCEYEIRADIYDAADYGVAQFRKRAIIKMYKKGLKWGEPSKEKYISIKKAIGNLPSLEANEKSNIKWHFARNHSKMHIECMTHTASGKSAFENKKFYPISKNGKKIKAYNTTYRRMKWDEPAPTITMRNDAISSQQNVHPGRKKPDGTYSDARVLTPLELMILSSLPKNWAIPDDTPELLIRKCLGECIPPLLIQKITQKIGEL
ncbi:DNA (cytosine-5-)-methyltransferase [Campylobacter hyointestinalis]|uniref:DNA (cytosine-5-)-methyltransferase n=1 Tax=Campylobacter hyointestinalis TaxID=198 RepID=UPI000DCC2BF2|nr:DNA cytosine methyltransferase [Campylobacter hyointestinalis]RAZ52571.1 DNA (cytosine-5-)-methyltransferase [Campylobacter hyointestinalis subsp. lawsonii]